MKIALIFVVTLLQGLKRSHPTVTYKYSKCNDEYCLYSDGIKRSQAQARAACEEDQKFLLELPDVKTSELADRFILEYFPDHFVFMNAYVEDSKWSWVNGKPMQKDEYKLPAAGDKAFAALRLIKTGDIEVDSYKTDVMFDHWICSHQQKKCPPPSVDLEGRCYFVRTKVNTTYWHALRDCYLIGAQLASFEQTSKHSLTNLSSILKIKSCYWIGLTKFLWRWYRSSSVLMYNHWNWGMMWAAPCVALEYNFNTANGYWQVVSCGSKAPSVCMASNRQGNSSSRNEIVLAVGWAVAGLLLIALVALLIFFKLKGRNKISRPARAPNRHSLYPVDHSKTPKNLPADASSRTSSNLEYVGSANYYENPTAPTPATYTELIN